ESGGKAGSGRGVESRRAGHDVSVREARCFPCEFDVSFDNSGAFGIEANFRPVSRRRPPVTVNGVAMPVDGIAEIRHPFTEAENAVFGGLRGEMGEARLLVWRDQALD